MSTASKPKISKIKLNAIQTPVQTLVQDPFEHSMRPYRDKVTYCLKTKTDLNSDLIQRLEDSLYKKAIKDAESYKCGRQPDSFKFIYMKISRHLIDNLKKDNGISNIYFIDLINGGKIDIETAINMSPQDMHPENWRVLVEKKLYTIDKEMLGPQATTDLFWCGRCHKNQCTYFERQDRCADEPMTVHITCCNCGNYWKR